VASVLALAWAIPAPFALKNADATVTKPTVTTKPANATSGYARSLGSPRVVTSLPPMASRRMALML
jgi:hypothetical protein